MQLETITLPGASLTAPSRARFWKIKTIIEQETAVAAIVVVDVVADFVAVVAAVVVIFVDVVADFVAVVVVVFVVVVVAVFVFVAVVAIVANVVVDVVFLLLLFFFLYEAWFWHAQSAKGLANFPVYHAWKHFPIFMFFIQELMGM